MNETSQKPLSPSAAVRRAYQALADYADPATFISTKPEAEALAEAAALEASGPAGKPFYGKVFAVKDNIDAKGLETTAACPAFAYRPTSSSFVVARLEAAGAIVIGKTNLDQFATGLVGVRSPYGVPRNALRPDLIPGGSSSGSAVSVAAGIVDFALGTDTAGSGRIPAGMNGIVGLKPTLGLLSATGMVPACRTLDTISVFARDVETAVAATAAASGYDAADAYSRVLPLPTLGALPKSFRVGVPLPAQRKFFGDAHAEAAYAADIARLTALGASIVELDFEPLHAVARLLYEGPWVAERYAATKPLIETDPDAFHPTTLKIIGGAKGLTAVSAFEAAYKLADLKRQTAPIFDQVDILAVPTVPRAYTVAELEADPIVLNSNLAPIPTSSICSTSPPSRCPPVSAATACPRASPSSARPAPTAISPALPVPSKARRPPARCAPPMARSSSPWSAPISPACRSTRNWSAWAAPICAMSPPRPTMRSMPCPAPCRPSPGCCVSPLALA